MAEISELHVERHLRIAFIFIERMKTVVPGFAEYSPLAKEIFDTSLRVKSGDKVWIQSWDHTLDLAVALASECSSRACPFLLTVRHEAVWLRSIIQGPKNRSAGMAPQEKAALAKTDHYIFTMGPRSPVPWNSIPHDRRHEVSVWLDARYDRSSYARTWAKIAKANKVRLLAVEATLATPERARAQGLDYEEWRNVMLRGCTPDHKVIARRARQLTTLMSGRRRLKIASSLGTQLTFELQHRPVCVSNGISTSKMTEKGQVVFLPAGAIEVSVDEESAEGKIVYGAPVRLGDEVLENLTLELKDGLITHYSATRGLEAFEHHLKRGGRNAGRFSYFGFGLNPNLRHGFTQDDKVLGGLTLGFGSNKSMGGKNSALNQWWASITGATVEIDGTILMGEGKLLV